MMLQENKANLTWNSRASAQKSLNNDGGVKQARKPEGQGGPEAAQEGHAAQGLQLPGAYSA